MYLANTHKVNHVHMCYHCHFALTCLSTLVFPRFTVNQTTMSGTSSSLDTFTFHALFSLQLYFFAVQQRHGVYLASPIPSIYLPTEEVESGNDIHYRLHWSSCWEWLLAAAGLASYPGLFFFQLMNGLGTRLQLDRCGNEAMQYSTELMEKYAWLLIRSMFIHQQNLLIVDWLQIKFRMFYVVLFVIFEWDVLVYCW